MITFRMKRQGSFQANWDGTRNVCGVDPSTRPVYSYTCELETSNNLDSQGFIVDNNEVVKHFTDRYATTYRVRPLSCELIAKEAVEYFQRLLESHGQEALKISVTVSAMSQAELTCSWEASKTKSRTKKVEEPLLAGYSDDKKAYPYSLTTIPVVINQAVVSLVYDKHKLDAIKLIRTLTNEGLYECKDYVDGIMDAHEDGSQPWRAGK